MYVYKESAVDTPPQKEGKRMHTLRQTVLPYKVKESEHDEEMTSLAGLPLVAEFLRRSGLMRQIRKLVHVKEAGWSEESLIEAVLLLVIAGGEHLDDMRILENDRGLQRLIEKYRPEKTSANTVGAMPTGKAIERFLKCFHRDELRPNMGVSWVPAETQGLQQLAEVSRWFVRKLIELRGLTRVTIENDATAVVSHKDEALGMYKDGRGYMPVNAVIAELGIVAAEEFRDGNVAPSFDAVGFMEKTLQAIPESVTEIRARLDGAYFQHNLIRWFRERSIKFTITSKLTSSLLTFIKALPEEEWKPLTKVTEQGTVDTTRDWAELDWTSANGSQEEMKERTVRMLVTRKREWQPELYEGMTSAEVERERYEVIATDFDWDGPALIRWHYERAGSIEQVHDRMKNDLAGHVLPCGEFGANAAWWRLMALAHNVVRAIQLHALPEKFERSRLKRLRFHLFCIAGRVVRHARSVILKLARGHSALTMYQDARLKIAALAFT
jgi:hypothetical protein